MTAFSRRRSVSVPFAVVIVLTASLIASACLVNQPPEGLAAVDRLQPSQVPVGGPTVADVAYGPYVTQRLDVHRPSGSQRGTIVYFHGGGWVAGTKSEVNPFLRSTVSLGFAVVSVDYRLAPDVRYPEMLADADRALRYVRMNAAALGVDASTLIVAGLSAGGYLAAMLAAAPGRFSDPDLPADLRGVDPRVDGLVEQVGPNDLTTFWQAPSSWAVPLSEELLGCAPGNTTTNRKPCGTNVARVASPYFWAALTAWLGGSLPPVYFSYGARDNLVERTTQADPIVDAWERAAGSTRVWYDLPPTGDHSPDFVLNLTIFKLWLGHVRDRSW